MNFSPTAAPLPRISVVDEAGRSWVLETPFAQGAFSRTFLARAAESDQEAIAKVLNVSRVKDWKQVELFEREAAALASISHPGIPRYYGRHISDDGCTLILIMERVPGAPLSTIIGKIPIEHTRLERWLRQGLEILEYLHSLVPPVLHRDITTRNILVAEDGLHLIDLGAVRIGTSHAAAVTEVGTFGFMAPEHVRGAPEPASDLYSLGISLLCVANGTGPDRLPIDGSSGGVQPERIAGLPSHLADVFAGLVALGLERRFKSADAALSALDCPPDGAARPTSSSARRTPVAVRTVGPHRSGIDEWINRNAYGPRRSSVSQLTAFIVWIMVTVFRGLSMVVKPFARFVGRRLSAMASDRPTPAALPRTPDKKRNNRPSRSGAER